MTTKALTNGTQRSKYGVVAEHPERFNPLEDVERVLGTESPVARILRESFELIREGLRRYGLVDIWSCCMAL